MNKPFDYKKAGVDIKAGDLWAASIGSMVKKAIKDPHVKGGIGGFAGLYQINENQLLAACCDGVGTKMELSKQAKNLSGLGQDLVAMNVNDLICCGARPIFFLDYLACGSLKPNEYNILIEDIIKACQISGCALLGGETAEMPDVYDDDGFDLAGFSVGIVDKDNFIDGRSVISGDIIVGVPSSGVHANGFSLVRQIVKEVGFTHCPIEDLLKPTEVYVPTVQEVLSQVSIKAMAHITGGGLKANVERVLGDHKAEIDWNSWKRPFVFDWLSQYVDKFEMQKVFNLGVGFVFVTSEKEASQVLEILDNAFICGKVI